ncbi:GNAT family N-acetyltransferase [Streptomyces seoulensis]|uniref:GNAT family N-acetyltransferase n=1 Tax=Streptomyces seoulensis TaxID=73044 RepID=A0A4P6TPB9_STRSO|nr:GNAT family N-acetyltransferase [Streptomyces seoulensis]QBJ89125.1 GNAT family N-acetyltransferase [Streptomyces seoulensis]
MPEAYVSTRYDGREAGTPAGADPGPAGTTAPHPLDHAARASLTGPHAHFAERYGRVLRYPVEVSPWLALPEEPGAADWAEIAALAGPGGEVPLLGHRGAAPEGWEITFDVAGVQMADDGVAGAPDPEAVPLGPADVPEMLDLVARTQPGPFMQRTVEMGTYLGIRRDGALIAMAGERLHPPGWTEISAVCTDPAFRGEGLATRLILAVAHGVRERGERPFLHTGAGNTGAIRLYESLGFRHRLDTRFFGVRVPSGA